MTTKMPPANPDTLRAAITRPARPSAVLTLPAQDATSAAAEEFEAAVAPSMSPEAEAGSARALRVLAALGVGRAA